MTLCKEEQVEIKYGCKQEEPNAIIPVLRTNFVPDRNGTTHHDPKYCAELQPVVEVSDKPEQKVANYKSKLIIGENIHSDFVEDGVRKILSFLWNTRDYKDDKQLYYVWTQGDNADDLLETRRRFNVTVSDDIPDKNTFSARSAKFKITGIKKQGYFPKGFVVDPITGYESFVSFEKTIKEAVKTGVAYSDFPYLLMVPFGEKDFEKYSILDGNHYKPTWKFEYNYNSPQFEKFVTEAKIPIQILPNLQVWFSEIENRKNESLKGENSTKRFSDLINLGNFEKNQSSQMPSFGVYKKSTFLDKYNPQIDSFMKNSSYFDEWKSLYEKSNKELIANLVKNYSQTLVGQHDMKLLNSFNNRFDFFPMSVIITFPNDTRRMSGDFVSSSTPLVTEALNVSKLGSSLLLYVVKNRPIEVIKRNRFVEEVDTRNVVREGGTENQFGTINLEETVKIENTKSTIFPFSFIDKFYEQNYVSLREKLSNSFSQEHEFSVKKEERKVWDITKWIEIFNKFEKGVEKLEKSEAIEVFKALEDENLTFLGSFPLFLREMDKKTFDFFKSIMYLLFLGKIKPLLRLESDGGKFRKFEDMMSFGKLCHNEQLFFKIDKVVKDGSRLVQSFYLSNTNEKEVMEWVDTQVRYGEEYEYRVFCYNLVFGTKYEYTNTNIFSNKKKTDTIGRFEKVVQEYDIGTPVAEIDVKYQPWLLLIEQPYFAFDGKILDNPPVPPEVDFISFIGVDDKIMINFRSNVGNFWDFPIFLNEEENKYYNSLPNQSGKIQFKNDDGVSSFEFSRIDFHPTEWNDFARNTKVAKSKSGAYAASVFESVELNKKYYYMFRSVDGHGHKSNPTSIYEVELRGESGGFIFLEIRTVDFKKSKNKQVTKLAKKYIQISPDVLQTIVDYKKTKSINSVSGVGGNDEVKSAFQLFPHVGIQEETFLNKDYKLRITSKKTGKKIDINFKFVHKHEKK